MTKATRVITKKRPPVTGTLVGVRLQPPSLTELDAWREKQADLPSRGGNPTVVDRNGCQATGRPKSLDGGKTFQPTAANGLTALKTATQFRQPLPILGFAATKSMKPASFVMPKRDELLDVEKFQKGHTGVTFQSS